MLDLEARSLPRYLLHPASQAQIKRAINDQSPLVINRNTINRYEWIAEALAVHNVIGASLYKHPRIRLYLDNDEIPPSEYTKDRLVQGYVVKDIIVPERVEALMETGCTVVIDDIDKTVPLVGAMAANLEEITAAAVSIRLTHHVDQSANWTLQNMYADTVILQLAGGQSCRIPGKDLVEQKLYAGGSMFIPSGVKVATFDSKSSTCIAITLLHPYNTVNYIGVADVLRERLFKRSQNRTGIRPADGNYQRLEREAISELIQELSSEIDLFTPTTRTGRAHFVTDLLGIETLSPDTMVYRRSGRLTLSEDGERIVLQWRNKQISFPKRAGHTVRFIAERRSFQPCELPLKEKDDQIALSRLLIEEGVCTFVGEEFPWSCEEKEEVSC
jgi:hypothetical protein